MKVLRYEIKNITPPHDILAAMEKQMRAEREKRAVILTSEGARDAAINNAEGEKQQVIKASEARRQQQINEAEGQASAILAVATATAEGIRQVAEAIAQPGGIEATQLRVAEQYVDAVRRARAEDATRSILPANVADIASMVATAMKVFQTTSETALGSASDGRAPVRVSRSSSARSECQRAIERESDRGERPERSSTDRRASSRASTSVFESSAITTRLSRDVGRCAGRGLLRHRDRERVHVDEPEDRGRDARRLPRRSARARTRRRTAQPETRRPSAARR